MTNSSATSSATIGMHIRRVPLETAAILADDASSVGRSRESHIRAILIDYARRIVSRRQKEGRRD